MKAQLLIGLAGALALAACNNATETQEPDSQATGDINPPTAETALPDTSTPQGFVDAAASSDMYEIEAAKIAEQRSANEKVKSFAEMMITDHTASTQKLKAAVAKAGGVGLPLAMQPKHRTDLDALVAAGDNFDALYANQQIAAHEEALALLKSQAASGASEPLKAFASETAPIVEGHLSHARELP
jgi:putative membrane protein